MTPYVLSLPWPPSVNHYLVNRKMRVRSGPKAGKSYVGRMLSEEGKAYRAEVVRAAREGHRAPPRFSGRLMIAAVYRPPTLSRVRDLDNLDKALWDSLRHAAVVADDSLFDGVLKFRANPRGLGQVTVAIAPCDIEFASKMLDAFGLAGSYGEADLLDWMSERQLLDHDPFPSIHRKS